MPVISASLLLLGVMLWKPATPRGEVDILDVGHGDAAAVFPPGGGAVLVDGGDLSDYHDYGREVVSPFLLAHGVTRLDAVFCTHPDRDHIGGLFSVLGMVQTARVILNPKVSNDELELRLIEQCRSLGIPVERLGAGDHFEIGDARFEVLHPPKEGWSAPSVNDTSIVMRLSWDSPGERDFSMLLTGDMEIPSEVLVAKEDCRAVILRAPHHGSATSSSAALIDAVAPDIAIASTRTTASRIAIGPGVAERYAARGIPLWRTDTGGGLRITGDPLAITSARATRWWATEPEGTGD